MDQVVDPPGEQARAAGVRFKVYPAAFEALRGVVGEGDAALRLDVGALFGKYVGDSEENTRNALRLAETLAPVVLWLDEVDKAFSGMDGASDGGVSSRVFGQFLTWMSEKRDNVFVVATANDFRLLFGKYPEFMRRGRFDEIFWVDLPAARTSASSSSSSASKIISNCAR
jgi:SpoVK/Ycf46/Vps4 family AAA+-type ATPase